MASYNWFALVCLVLIPSLHAESVEGPIVKLKNGAVRGSFLTSDEGNVINAFRGIPYAKPPVKELRFKPTEPAEPWTGTLDATEDGASCIQFAMLQNRFTGDEDCLFVNVYTPQISEEKKKFLGPLPVMAFIHGGGYVWGSGESQFYGPQRLLDREIILVTFNYRLAALGFLSTADEAAPGNYGLYDQVQALRWIQENIREFGGDPDRVTLFGESAGSMSVVFHLMSPLSAGLFHAAIGESGSPVGGFGIIENPMEFTKRLGQKLGCPSDVSNDQLISCIKRKPALDILVLSQEIEAETFLKFEDHPVELLYGAVPEKTRGAGSPFLPEDFLEQLDKGNFNKVPAIFGVNQDEGLQLYAMLTLLRKSQGRQQANEVVPNMLSSFNRHLPEKEQKLVYQKVYNQYFADKMDEEQVTRQLVKFYGDILFAHCTDLTVQKLSAGGVQVYPYKFTYARYPPLQVFRPTEDFLQNDTVNHAEDLPMLFRSDYFKGTGELEGDNLLVSDLFVTLWTNFAKTRRPTLDGARFEFPSFEWESYVLEKPRFLDISLNPAMKDGHLCKRTPFWIKLAESNRKPETKDEL